MSRRSCFMRCVCVRQWVGPLAAPTVVGSVAPGPPLIVRATFALRVAAVRAVHSVHERRGGHDEAHLGADGFMSRFGLVLVCGSHAVPGIQLFMHGMNSMA